MIPKYRIVIFWSEEDQLYVAHIPDLPGTASHGDTYEEALKQILEAMSLTIELMKEDGYEPPKPTEYNLWKWDTE